MRKIKLLKRLGTKLTIITALTIVVSVSVTSSSQHIGSKRIVDDVLRDNAQSGMNAIHNKVEELSASSMELTKIIAGSEDMILAVQGLDTGLIKDTATAIMYNERSDVEFILIADSTGTVLARTHNDVAGDSIATHRNVKGALGGKAASYVETGTTVKLSIISSAPIKDDQGRIIGTCATGYQLDKPEFVDSIKAMTGTDITLFLGDERINTTIMENNVRMIGTKLSPAVADTVLNQRQNFGAITTILDRRYYAVYEPIITEGDAIGVYFSGKDIEDIKQFEARLILTILAIVGTSSIIILLLSLAITRRMIVKPVMALSNASLELARGNLNINLPTLKSHDEIGMLTESVRGMAGVLTGIIKDMDKMANEHAKGDTDARIDISLYDGAYQDVATGVNSMAASYVKHLNDLCDVLQAFGDGDFSAEYALLPGKKRAANTVVEELRGNLRDISNEIKGLVKAALDGRLSARADTGRFNNDWRLILENLNAVMDAVVEPMNEASSVLGEMSAGQLSAVVRGEYKGDFEIIKRSLNSTQAALSAYIAEIDRVLSEVSSNNMDVSVDREFIGDFSAIRSSINNIIDFLNQTFNTINSAAENVAIGARHISESSTRLSEGATEQAASIEELTAIIEQVSLQTDENARAAREASEVAKGVKEHTEKESQLMESMVKAMTDINEASNNIARIIKVIDDIAFQTNLLALNASVEAARAGEHGKGFAVVAEEVRTLASRSKEAAASTESLIESSIQKVSEGVRTANETAHGLDEIVQMISEISRNIENISDASEAQQGGIQTIGKGIEEISHVAQNNTAISEESAASAEELSSQADTLHSAVAKFKLRG